LFFAAEVNADRLATVRRRRPGSLTNQGAGDDATVLGVIAILEPFGDTNLQKRVLALTEQTYLTDGLERTVANYRLAALRSRLRR
jgi:hypothetical protein